MKMHPKIMKKWEAFREISRNFVLRKFLFLQKFLQKSHKNFPKNKKSIKFDSDTACRAHVGPIRKFHFHIFKKFSQKFLYEN
jgi:hypothetical protein